MMALVAILIMIVLMLIGVPIAYAFLGPAAFLTFTTNITSGAVIPYGFKQMDSIVMLTMPLFILAGNIMNEGGLGDKLIAAVNKLVGRITGGLGIVTVITCAVFGALSGSSSATIASIGGIMAPRLEDAGYDKGFIGALISTSGVLGLLIPPSMIQILYAWSSGTSVLACFLAIIGPGLMVTTLASLVTYTYAKKKPQLVQMAVDMKAASHEKKQARAKGEHGAFAALLMPIIILGSIYGGILTPTESAAISVAYAIPVGWLWYKRLNGKTFKNALINCCNSTGQIFMLVLAIGVLSRMFNMLNVPQQLADLILSVSDSPIVVMLMVNLFMAILGMFMDDVTGTLLCATLLVPIVNAVGVSSIQFAGILAANMGMALVTPPCAGLLYMGGKIARTTVGEMLPYTMRMIVFVWIPTILMATFVPQFTLFLPKLFGYA